MASTTQSAQKKNFSKPDETRPFDKGKLEIVNVGGTMLGRATFEPPAGISTIVLPDLYANSSESAGRVDRVTGPGGAAIFVAHLQPGDRLRLGPGYARVLSR